MIPSKTRESRRVKSLKLPKNIERLYKEGKCRECSVVVTRMNFAKILGKFTKVKIQYESSSKPKGKCESGAISNNSNSKLGKKNENGMVQRNSYNHHPVKDQLGAKNSVSTTRQTGNILKENNSLKRSLLKDKNSNYDNIKKQINSNVKQYAIVFDDPKTNNIDIKNKSCLSDLLPIIDESILPSEEWCIDYYPKNDEPKDDKVYDRIAAELEDLMYNDKPVEKTDIKSGSTEPKTDEFPSIMDILNENSSEKLEPTTCPELKSNIESNDVEAMLLGQSDPTDIPSEPTPMEVDDTNVSNSITDANQLNATADTAEDKPMETSIIEEIDNPHSPSILDEALQKGIEEHLPSIALKEKSEVEDSMESEDITESKNNSESKDITASNDSKESADKPEPTDDTESKDDIVCNDETEPKDSSESNSNLESNDITESISNIASKDNLEDEDDTEPKDDTETKDDTESKDNIESKDNTESKDNPESTDSTESKDNTEKDNIVDKESIENEVKIELTEVSEDTQIPISHSVHSDDTKDNEMAAQAAEIIAPIEPKSEMEVPKLDIPKENPLKSKTGITEVIFKKCKDGKCLKSVTCPKNLKYTINLDGKSVELLGAPKFLSSLEDLQVLLQIVNESELDSLHVMH